MTVVMPRTANAGQAPFDITKIVAAADVLPWKITDISLRPYPGFWSFNPSIHFDGETWRCMLRCADYAMPKGRLIRGPNARLTCVQSKNALVVLDPATWRSSAIYLVSELDGLPRNGLCANVGFEDMRLFRTAEGGLQGIAASLHLERTGSRNAQCPPEQVLLSFDDEYNVIEAQPLRGAWSGVAQKNWVPFDNAVQPRFLYSIDRGTVFDADGPMTPAGAAPFAGFGRVDGITPPASPPTIDTGRVTSRGRVGVGVGRHRVTEVRVARRAVTVNAGRSLPPGYGGIRGGSQLVFIGNDQYDAWLGIGHEMRFYERTKFYWHSFYTVNSMGQMTAKSEAVKIYPDRGIEFAAGLAIDGDRVVISFGVDDMECKIAETSLDAVKDLLVPVGPTP